MYVKFHLENLNFDLTSRPISTYTCRVTITSNICGGYTLIYVKTGSQEKKKYNFYHNLTLIVSGENKQTILDCLVMLF